MTKLLPPNDDIQLVQACELYMQITGIDHQKFISEFSDLSEQAASNAFDDLFYRQEDNSQQSTSIKR